MAILDTGVNTFSSIAKRNAVLDRHEFRVAVPSRRERGSCRVVPNAIKRQMVGPIIVAQWGEPTCSIQVRTSLEEAHRVVERRQGHESEVPFDEVAWGRRSRI